MHILKACALHSTCLQVPSALLCWAYSISEKNAGRLHAGMSSLRLLWLSDNPLALSQLYRIDVLACFPESQQLLLDGKRHRRAEHETASLRAQVHMPVVLRIQTVYHRLHITPSCNGSSLSVLTREARSIWRFWPHQSVTRDVAARSGCKLCQTPPFMSPDHHVRSVTFNTTLILYNGLEQLCPEHIRSWRADECWSAM